jgi:hypothetical protein
MNPDDSTIAIVRPVETLDKERLDLSGRQQLGLSCFKFEQVRQSKSLLLQFRIHRPSTIGNFQDMSRWCARVLVGFS